MSEFAPIGTAALRLALVGLRQEEAPAHDLWPGIEARLTVVPAKVAARKHRIWPLAMAASMLLALGLAWHGGLSPASKVPVHVPDNGVLPEEALAMTRQHQAALLELDLYVPASWRPGLDALDRSAEQVLAALRERPDSMRLLDQLRHIYARRIALSRRAVFT